MVWRETNINIQKLSSNLNTTTHITYIEQWDLSEKLKAKLSKKPKKAAKPRGIVTDDCLFLDIHTILPWPSTHKVFICSMHSGMDGRRTAI